MKGMNKKGQGLSTNTIILLVLGLLVLAALAIGFSGVWKGITSEIGKTNVDEVSEGCRTSCSLNERFGFCSNDVEVRIQERELKYKTSCGVLASLPEFKEMTVNACPNIKCDVPCKNVRINGFSGEPVDSVEDGYYDVTAFASNAEGKSCAILKA